MPTILSSRTTKSASLAALAWLVGCGTPFSTTAAESDAAVDAPAAAADAPSDGRTSYCAAISASFCDDFDGRTSGFEGWTSQTASNGAKLAFDNSECVSAPNCVLTKASSSGGAAYAVLGYDLTARTVSIDFAVKVDSVSVPTGSLLRLVSVTARGRQDAFRIDLLKSPGNTYELRASTNSEYAGEALLLDGMSAIESGWHKITWNLKSPTFSATGHTPGTTEVKIDGRSLGQRSVEFDPSKLEAVAAAITGGLRFYLGTTASGEASAQIRYDNVSVTNGS